MAQTRESANITHAYLAAKHAGYEDTGRGWYRDAHAIAIKLDPTDPGLAAGVIAALSPQTDWARNVRLAVRAYRDGHATGTLGASCRKATAILAGNEPDDTLSGDKVRAFWRLICDPSDAHTVCIDRHAVAIAEGDGQSGKRTITSKRYEQLAHAYRLAARQLSRQLGYRITAAEVQSVTWCWYRDHVRPNRRGLIG